MPKTKQTREAKLEAALKDLVIACRHVNLGVAEWHSMGNLPPIGSKFIALYSDGSGATMFFRHDGGFIDCEGDEIPALNPKSYDRWIELPQDMEFWCEVRSEDPFTLTDTSHVPNTRGK